MHGSSLALAGRAYSVAGMFTYRGGLGYSNTQDNAMHSGECLRITMRLL